jgi:CBS domain-containing protein
MTLGDLFSRKVVTAFPKESLASVARRMQERNVGTVLIEENHKPVGMVTDRDLALALGAEGISPQASVEKVMTSTLRTIRKDAGVLTATRCMRDYEVRRLPIVDENGSVVGIVSFDDLLRLLGRELFNLVEGIKHETETR